MAMYATLKETLSPQIKLKEGFLWGHKRNVGSNRQAWKQRWAVIVGNRLEMFYERSSKTASTACDLTNATGVRICNIAAAITWSMLRPSAFAISER